MKYNAERANPKPIWLQKLDQDTRDSQQNNKARIEKEIKDRKASCTCGGCGCLNCEDIII